MITDSIEFRGFDGARYANLTGLARGRGGAGPPGLVLLRRDGQVVLAHHTHRGRLEAGEVSGEGTLEEEAQRQGARWAVAVDGEALEAIHESVAGAFRVGGDGVEMALLLIEAAGREVEAGRLELTPNLVEGVGLPSRRTLDRVLDIVFPPGSTVLIYVFDGPRLFGEVVLARGPRQITLIGGHDVLESGPPPRRWREDYKRLLSAAERELGPPSLGVFVSVDVARAWMRGDRSVDPSRALARKDLILDPLPMWLAGPLGVAAVRGVMEAGRKAGTELVERVRPTGLAGKLAGKVAGRMRREVSERLHQSGAVHRVEEQVDRFKRRADLGEVLGFDPFLLGRRLAEFWREGEVVSDRRSPTRASPRG